MTLGRRALGVAALVLSMGTTCALAEITLVARSGAAPFTDADWPAAGMIAELTSAALAQSPDPLPTQVTWRDSAAAQRADLVGAQGDMALALSAPDCAAAGALPADCARFHFSDPLAELAVLLFTPVLREFRFEGPDDLTGRSLCSPATLFGGEATAPLMPTPVPGLRVQTAPTVAACFAQMQRGEVDAVAVNEFTGVQYLFDAGLTEEIVPLTRPLTTQTLHLAISKTHWRGTAHLYRVNAGLANLRATDEYARIVARHVAHFWARLRG